MKLPDYKEENVNAATTGGSSSISLTIVSIADEEISPVLIWQKKFGYIWDYPYAGSFRFRRSSAPSPPGVEIYTLDLEVVGRRRLAEAAAWFFTRVPRAGGARFDPTATDGKKTGGWAMWQERAAKRERRPSTVSQLLDLIQAGVSIYVQENESWRTIRCVHQGRQQGIGDERSPGGDLEFVYLPEGQHPGKDFWFKTGNTFGFKPGVRSGYDWSSTVPKSKLRVASTAESRPPRHRCDVSTTAWRCGLSRLVPASTARHRRGAAIEEMHPLWVSHRD